MFLFRKINNFFKALIDPPMMDHRIEPISILIENELEDNQILSHGSSSL
jgi:hypothetical protein